MKGIEQSVRWMIEMDVKVMRKTGKGEASKRRDKKK